MSEKNITDFAKLTHVEYTFKIPVITPDDYDAAMEKILNEVKDDYNATLQSRSRHLARMASWAAGFDAVEFILEGKERDDKFKLAYAAENKRATDRIKTPVVTVLKVV